MSIRVLFPENHHMSIFRWKNKTKQFHATARLALHIFVFRKPYSTRKLHVIPSSNIDHGIIYGHVLVTKSSIYLVFSANMTKIYKIYIYTCIQIQYGFD